MKIKQMLILFAMIMMIVTISSCGNNQNKIDSEQIEDSIEETVEVEDLETIEELSAEEIDFVDIESVSKVKFKIPKILYDNMGVDLREYTMYKLALQYVDMNNTDVLEYYRDIINNRYFYESNSTFGIVGEIQDPLILSVTRYEDSGINLETATEDELLSEFLSSTVYGIVDNTELNENPAEEIEIESETIENSNEEVTENPYKIIDIIERNSDKCILKVEANLDVYDVHKNSTVIQSTNTKFTGYIVIKKLDDIEVIATVLNENDVEWLWTFANSIEIDKSIKGVDTDISEYYEITDEYIDEINEEK